MILYLRKRRQQLKEVIEDYEWLRLPGTYDMTEPCSLFLWGRLVRNLVTLLRSQNLLQQSKDSSAFLTSGPGGVHPEPNLCPSLTWVDLWHWAGAGVLPLSRSLCMLSSGWRDRSSFCGKGIDRWGLPRWHSWWRTYLLMQEV